VQKSSICYFPCQFDYKLGLSWAILLCVVFALNYFMLSQPTMKGAVVPAFLHPSVLESLASTNLLDDFGSATPMQARQPGSINLYTKSYLL
jgi:hypothetical protein